MKLATHHASDAGGELWTRPPVLSPVPQQTYRSQFLASPSKNKFACGHLFRHEQGHHRIDRGDDPGELNTSPTNNLLLILRHWNVHDQDAPCTLVKTNATQVL